MSAVIGHAWRRVFRRPVIGNLAAASVSSPGGVPVRDQTSRFAVATPLTACSAATMPGREVPIFEELTSYPLSCQENDHPCDSQACWTLRRPKAPA